MKSIRLAALAVDDLRDAVQWYEQQRAGLGGEFAQQTDRLLSKMAENPLQFPVVHRDVRRALVRPFPYGIFFRDLGSILRIVAIVHLHRHPSTWRTRR